MAAITLAALVEEDGVKVGADGNALCVFHKETDGSLHFSFEQPDAHGRMGLFHCFGCGEAGDSVDWLVKHRKMTKAAALEMANGELRPAARAPDTTQQSQPPKKPPTSLPRTYSTLHEYPTADGSPHGRVYRTNMRNGTKTFRQWKAAPETRLGWTPGGFDPILYRLPLLAANPDRPVLIVEGEKAVEALEKLDGWNSLVTTFPGGAAGFKAKTGEFGPKSPALTTDLAVLEGRRVTLWPDNDPGGKAAMAALGMRLKAVSDPRLVTLPKGTPPKWDAADAVKAGWSAERIARFLKRHRREIAPAPPPENLPPPEVSEATPNSLHDNPHFSILGFANESVVILVKSTGEIILRKYTALSMPMSLLSIAPESFWLAAVNWARQMTVAVREGIAAALIYIARNKGMYDAMLERGRGVWMTRDDRVVIHLGDRLLFPDSGHEAKLADGPKPEIYRVEPPVIMTKGKGREKVRELATALHCYRWRSQADAINFIGWLICSPIGGILQYRPHTWLSGEQDSGKTWLLTNIVHPLMQDWLIHVVAGTTPAGLRRSMTVGARPVLFDESEARGQSGRILAEEVSALMRVSTSGDGSIIMAAEHGQGVNRYRPKSSFMLVSIARPKLDKATESRVSVINLALRGVANWEKVSAEIKQAMLNKDEILSSILRNSASIKQTIDTTTDIIISDRDQGSRDAMQRGTLIGATAWAFGATPKTLPAMVKKLSDHIEQRPMVSDADTLLDEILSAQIRTGDPHNPIVSIERAILVDPKYADILGDHGIRRARDNILIAAAHPGLSRLLRGTNYANAELHGILARHDGATTRNRLRIGGRLQRNVVGIHLDSIQLQQFDEE